MYCSTMILKHPVERMWRALLTEKTFRSRTQGKTFPWKTTVILQVDFAKQLADMFAKHN